MKKDNYSLYLVVLSLFPTPSFMLWHQEIVSVVKRSVKTDISLVSALTSHSIKVSSFYVCFLLLLFFISWILSTVSFQVDGERGHLFILFLTEKNKLVCQTMTVCRAIFIVTWVRYKGIQKRVSHFKRNDSIEQNLMMKIMLDINSE